MTEAGKRYSTISILLHWLIAALVLVQILLISAHDATEGPMSREFVQIHKSVGLAVLLLTLFRIGWRVANPPPAPPATMKPWEKALSGTVHVLFYVALIVLPLTGWAASSAMGREIVWFGLFNWPLLPVGGGRETAGALMDLHGIAVKTVYGLVALHVIGALKHQFIDRDTVLGRMVPFLARRP